MNSFFEKIGWYPGIGDPSFMGWFTVFAYFITALLSLKVVSISNAIFARRRQRQKQLWIVTSSLLIFLCINKQLDLQSFLTASGRHLLQEWGMNEYKRDLQKLFIGSIFIGSIIILTLMIKELYQVAQKHLLAIIGIVFLSMFILIRASSFHNVDSFISYRLIGLKLNWILELGGIGLIFANGILLLQRRKKIKIVKKHVDKDGKPN